MFARFSRGPIPAEHGLPAYVSIEEYVPSGYDGSDDQSQLMLPAEWRAHVDAALVEAHNAEKPVGP
jgi:hypothetical protein